MIASVSAVMRASSAVNRPPWNSAETSGTALTASASAAGRHSSIASSAAWPWTRAALSASPAPTWRLTWGRMAVPSAAPITPSGSWFRRSA